MTTLRFPPPFDVVQDDYMKHSQADSDAIQRSLQSLSAAPLEVDPNSKMADPLDILSDLVTTSPMARDCIIFGGISTLTRVLQSDLTKYQGRVVVALKLIHRLCLLAPIWQICLSIAEANTLTVVGTLLESDEWPVRSSAAEVITGFVTSLKDVFLEKFVQLLPISKTLVDIIQRQSWKTERAAATALWAIADIEFDEEVVSSALDEWSDQFIDDAAEDPAGGAPDEFDDGDSDDDF